MSRDNDSRVAQSAGKKMAAPRTMRARDRLGGAQPLEDESDTDGIDGEASVTSFVSSKLYATLLVLPGIILYVYILYIILANLLYPCSLSPFFPRNRSSSSATSDTGLQPISI